MESAGRRGRGFRRSQVTAALARRAVAGIVPGDHVCASFGGDAEHQAIVGRFARGAVGHGARFLYLAHSSDDAAIRRNLEMAGVDVQAGLELGTIEIRRICDRRRAIHAEALVAELQADRREALRDGYSALCVTTEMSWVLARPAELDAVAAYERAVSRVFAAADVAGICQYDRRLFTPDVLEQLVPTHDFQVCTSPRLTTTARRRLTVSERDDGIIALSGALDIDSSPFLAARLAEFEGAGDLVLLTGGLGFADVSGCRALIRAAESLGDGRRLVLPDAAAPLVRVLELCGWSASERLVLA